MDSWFISMPVGFRIWALSTMLHGSCLVASGVWDPNDYVQRALLNRVSFWLTKHYLPSSPVCQSWLSPETSYKWFQLHASAPKPPVLPWVPPAIGSPLLVLCPPGNLTPHNVWVGVYRALQWYSGTYSMCVRLLWQPRLKFVKTGTLLSPSLRPLPTV